MSRAYEHKVQYYETDQMGIVHHSNYIRWFEEARCDLMEQAGLGYAELEQAGVIIPVVSVSAQYKSMTHFGETVRILARVTAFNGIRMELSYEVRERETGALRCAGTTAHCFLDRDGRLLSLKRSFPEIYRLFYERFCCTAPESRSKEQGACEQQPENRGGAKR